MHSAEERPLHLAAARPLVTLNVIGMEVTVGGSCKSHSVGRRRREVAEWLRTIRGKPGFPNEGHGDPGETRGWGGEAKTGASRIRAGKELNVRLSVALREKTSPFLSAEGTRRGPEGSARLGPARNDDTSSSSFFLLSMELAILPQSSENGLIFWS